MKVHIKRLDDAYEMEATNEQGKTLRIDASPELGGSNKGFRPMQMLLAAIGGCSGIDVINILKKQRQDITDFQVEINGERQPEVIPSLFIDIELHFILKGANLDADKVKRAIELSLEKYCSVAKTLEKTARISYRYTLNPA